MSRRHRAQAYHPQNDLAVPTLSEALSLCSIIEDGRAYQALSSTQHRLVTNRAWVAKPPSAVAGYWQVNERGIEALRRVQGGDVALRNRVDALHARALTENEEWDAELPAQEEGHDPAPSGQ